VKQAVVDFDQGEGGEVAVGTEVGGMVGEGGLEEDFGKWLKFVYYATCQSVNAEIAAGREAVTGRRLGKDYDIGEGIRSQFTRGRRSFICWAIGIFRSRG
jgi:hypothetical protein